MRRTTYAFLLACLLGAMPVRGVSGAATPGPDRGAGLNPTPSRIVTGRDGALWFTELEGNRIGRITPGGAFSFYPLPTPRSSPYGIAAAGDAIWFTERYRGAIGRLDVPTGQVTEYAAPTRDSDIVDIAAAGDGSVWFTELRGDRIGHLVPSTGVIVEYPVAWGHAPNFIAAGRDGGMWFTEPGGHSIGRIARDGHIAEYPLSPRRGKGGDYQSYPTDIALGPDGALWFAEQNLLQVGRITAAGRISRFQVGSPVALTVGPDSGIWFVNGDGSVGRLDLQGVRTRSFPPLQPPLLPADPVGQNVTGIAAGPDGALWLTAGRDSAIVRLSIAGAVSRFQIPGSSGEPLAVAPAPDGALWIAQPMLNALGRRAPDGTLREYPVPTRGAEPNSLSVAADGGVWFSEPLTDKVGHLSVDGQFAEYPLPAGSSPVSVLLSQDGRTLWVAERGRNMLGRLDIATGTVGQLRLPQGATCPDALAANPQGGIWFGLCAAQQIGRVGADGVVALVPSPNSTYGLLRTAREGGIWVMGQPRRGRLDRDTGAVKLDRYYTPTTFATPADVAQDRDGSAWFTEDDTNLIGHVDMASRTVTEYPVPTAQSAPNGICVDARGTVWFVERAGNALATIAPDGTIREFPLPTVPDTTAR